MRSISTLSIITLGMIFLACSNKSKTDGGNVTETQSPSVSPTNPTQIQASDPVQQNNSVVKPTTVTTQPGTTNSAGLNPAHGEPGHRCDIPVGSPLNSKPAQQPVVNNSQVVQPPVIQQTGTTTIPATGNTTTAPGMNPAHGQPGHRCDIAVGAPLNSKPTQTTASQGNTFTLPATQQVTPVKPVPGTPKNQ